MARDLVRRGYRIAIPYGEDWDFDLIFQRPDSDDFERVQVKYTRSDGSVVAVPCYSHSLTNGRVRQTKHYTAATIDWLAVYEPSRSGVFTFRPGSLASGRSRMHLRLQEARNGQSNRIRYADDYADPREPPQPKMKVEPAGLEPAPSRMQTGRSPN